MRRIPLLVVLAVLLTPSAALGGSRHHHRHHHRARTQQTAPDPCASEKQLMAQLIQERHEGKQIPGGIMGSAQLMLDGCEFRSGTGRYAPAG